MADEEEAEETFESTDAGSSHTYPMEGGQIRKGGYIMIKGNPCKVSDVSTSKTGKHGHAKVSCSVRGLAGRRWPAGNLLASRLAGSLALSLMWS